MSEQEYIEVAPDFNPGHPDFAGWRGEPEAAEPRTAAAAEAPEAAGGEQTPVTGWDPNNVVTGDGSPYTLGADGTRYYEPQELHSDGPGESAPPVLDLNALSVEELRARCKEAKLPTTGKHSELVARLAEHAGAQLLAEQKAE
ncbi:SAP domain-containing protein [Amycolatopsis tolypomycina]|uniref:SAP domain-containing protein n=1 Tax=Amycolatopsis tolypomycina TaxID=208445 RepID=UPI00339F9263